MRRLSFLVILVCILVALLAVPVCAAELAYQFEMRPAVEFLPVFAPAPDTYGAVFECPADLPEGEYVAFVSDAASGDVFLFAEPFVVRYSYSDEFGCMLSEFAAQLQNDISSAGLIVKISPIPDEELTVCVFTYDSGVTKSFGEAAYLTLIPVGSVSDPRLFLKDVVSDLLGPYEQQTETITQTLADGSTVTVEQRIPGIAGLDYEWFAAVCLFGLMLYCFFRLLGGVFK